MFLYLGILGLGLMVETLIIDTLLGDYTMYGRFALAGGHLNIMKNGLEGEKSPWGIITRWQMLPNYTYLPAITGLFSAFYFVDNRSAYHREYCLALCFLSFAFFLSFGVVSLKPVRFLLPHMPRYTNVIIPLSLLLILIGVGKMRQYRYLVIVFLLFAFSFAKPFNDLLYSPLHRQFYKIDKFQQEVNDYLDKGYAYIFFNIKKARLYRALFVNDRVSMGLDGAEPAKIYIVPPGKTRFNPNRTIYILTLKQNNVIAGIVRPYPHEYRLSVEHFTSGDLRISQNWELF